MEPRRDSTAARRRFVCRASSRISRKISTVRSLVVVAGRIVPGAILRQVHG